jgi:hypothetical protein
MENRYPIVFGSWLASMGIALGIVSRNPYLSGPQKLVQARVYAQGLTVAVLIASFAFETNDATKGKGRWETIKVIDPNDPEHKHLIEKRIHHESYAGEDQWLGKSWKLPSTDQSILTHFDRCHCRRRAPDEGARAEAQAREGQGRRSREDCASGLDDGFWPLIPVEKKTTV